MSYNILPNVRVQTDLDLATATVKDRLNSVGTNGQALTKDNTGLVWSTPTAALPDPIVSPNLDFENGGSIKDYNGSFGTEGQVLVVNPDPSNPPSWQSTANIGINLTGSRTITGGDGNLPNSWQSFIANGSNQPIWSSTSYSNVHLLPQVGIKRTLTDTVSSAGSANQVLSKSTGNDVVWQTLTNTQLPTTINQNLSLVGLKSFTDYTGSTGTTGQILMRDATGPMWMTHNMGSAEIYWSTNFGAVAEYLTFDIGKAGSPGGAALVPTTTLNTSYTFDMPGNGQLRYTGIPTVHCHVAFSLSVRGNAGSAKNIRFYIKKSGVTVTGSDYTFTVKTSTEYQTIAAHKIIDLATNEYLEIWAQNITDATELNVQNFNLQLMFSY